MDSTEPCGPRKFLQELLLHDDSDIRVEEARHDRSLLSGHNIVVDGTAGRVLRQSVLNVDVVVGAWAGDVLAAADHACGKLAGWCDEGVVR